ncbi:thiamine pyrophosphate-dependent enzyme [Candidatus Dojkabacteria bacterium]|jgi:transketolase|nr:thiamine pyrophosphate-dependent enzyme [Candidatus Dojkabacteria bacterium]
MEKVKQIQKDILIASYEAGACHLGSALSCVDILHDLFYIQKIKPEQFLFAKASGVACYYAILADLGYFPKDKLGEYLKQYPLPSKEVAGIQHSFGSLGHGLSVATGLALSDRNRDIYVLLSDGECQEGSTLEAVAFIGHHNLTNLHVIVDNNKIQALGHTRDIIKMDTIWNYMENNLPNCKIVNTVKGQGIDFMEDSADWHYKNLTKELLDKALCQI